MKLCSPWIVVLVAAVTACAPADTDRGAPGAAVDRDRASVDLREHRRVTEAASLLRGWDHRRALAWSRGDAAGLADLYTRGSGTGRHDRAMLAAYLDRGLRVAGLQTQVLAVSLRSMGPGRFTMEVTDRVVGAYALADGVRIPLPHDRPSTRLVSMRRVAGAWRVDEVRPVPRPARP